MIQIYKVAAFCQTFDSHSQIAYSVTLLHCMPENSTATFISMFWKHRCFFKYIAVFYMCFGCDIFDPISRLDISFSTKA